MNRESLTKTAVVRLEGTLSVPGTSGPREPGLPREGAAAKLLALATTHRVVVVSALCYDDFGVRLVTDWLYQHGFSAGFDELWQGWGAPAGDVFYDSEARRL